MSIAVHLLPLAKFAANPTTDNPFGKTPPIHCRRTYSPIAPSEGSSDAPTESTVEYSAHFFLKYR